MLFDLRGRGRRNVIKVVYLFLALLLGGGLVLFGIGGNTGSGGLVDAFTDGSGETSAGDYEGQIADARARLRTNPDDEAAHGDLIRAQVSLATTGDKVDPDTFEYTEAGQADLRAAIESWNAYQEIDPQDSAEEASLASRIVEAYRGIADAEGLVDVLEIIALERNAVGPYSQFAAAAYAVGQTRKGDLAAEKAIELEDPDERSALRQQLDSAKAQSPSATAAPVEAVTPGPTGPTGAKKSGGGKQSDK